MTKKGILTVVTEARDRHSVLQVAAPLELNGHDPVQLRDTQTCQALLPLSLGLAGPSSLYASVSKVCVRSLHASRRRGAHS